MARSSRTPAPRLARSSRRGGGSGSSAPPALLLQLMPFLLGTCTRWMATPTTTAAVLNPATQIRLFNATNYGGSAITYRPLINASSCQRLPSAFANRLRSAEITWRVVGAPANSTGTAAVTVCDYVWFFTSADCDFNSGTNRAVRIAQSPYRRDLNSITRLASFSGSNTGIQNAQSFACTFFPNPCSNAAVCSADRNTTCNPFPTPMDPRIRLDRSLNPPFPLSNTGFQCVCRPGFVRANGICRAMAELCAALRCPSDSKCEFSSTGTPQCVCGSDNYRYNATTGKCEFIAQARWLTSQNAARAAAGVAAMTWDNTLTAKARAWAIKLTSVTTGWCNAFDKDPSVNASQNYYATTYFNDEESAVAEWLAEKPNVCSKATGFSKCIHYARIVAPKVTRVGCGKASCILNDYTSTTFVCFYTPFVG